MKVKLIFAWYDVWIGFFWDRNKRKLYFFPIPTLGAVFTIPKKKKKPTKPTICRAGMDGECNHPLCPQTLANEPEKSGRFCPLPHWSDDRI